MNLHEYQAKELLSFNGVPTQRGKMVSNIKDVDTAANQLKNDTSTDFFVVKADTATGHFEVHNYATDLEEEEYVAPATQTNKFDTDTDKFDKALLRQKLQGFKEELQ